MTDPIKDAGPDAAPCDIDPTACPKQGDVARLSRADVKALGLRDEIAALCKRALNISLDVMARNGAGAADVRVDVNRNASANVRFARNEPTTSGELDETTVTCWVGFGMRHASTSINQIDDASIAALAQRALTMAKLAPEDPEKMPLLGEQQYSAVPPSYDEGLATMTPEQRAAIAARAIRRADAANVKAAGFFLREANEHAMANSEGLVARSRSTSGVYHVTARTADETGSGWAGGEAWRREDLEDDLMSSRAIDKATRSANPKVLPPGKYTVILEPQAVYELLAFMVGAMDQRSADEGRSFFAGKLGQKLFPDFVSLRSDPADMLTPGAPYDHEGFPLTTLPWIVEGRVNKLEVSRFWAKKKGLEPTGHPSVVHLSGGKAESVEEMMKGVKRGLIVTRLYYNRMLEPQSITVTGLTRDGVFLVEDGKITGPVANFRYNESPITVLKNVDAMTLTTTRVVSNDGIWQVPALRTNDFTMASTSAAI
jgi:predicted Zn-dependent protease